ncbi:glycosyltransferase family 4 protein [Hominifimenecus sp. rT4P-3]|uniref:glycosyltransferase family 4 protein n=1 Tax=Hominifimenecus sp. rT4P-3 TaxID=3242979 RepID=UPI003DA5BC7B
MKKLGFVIPWFGEKIPGGAEMELRGLTTHLHEAGVELEILTTCVKEFASDWNLNYYKPGLDTVLGMPVRRFRVRLRDGACFDYVNKKLMMNQEVSEAEQETYVRESVNSTELYDYMRKHADEYSLFVFIPYMFGTTFYGCQVCPEKSVLIPCFHDESYFYMSVFRNQFSKIRGIIYHAEPEYELTNRYYDMSQVEQAVLGEGVDTELTYDAGRGRETYHLDFPYLLYAGRKDKGKNVHTLLAYFAEYKKRQDTDLKLVLIGGGQIEIPREIRDDVVDLGFISIQDKYDVTAGALALCQPSTHESFSLVVMESWLCGRPVLVHGDCEVTSHFARKSNGGLYFNDYFEFEGCLNYFQANPEQATAMGDLGQQFVIDHFSWKKIVEIYLQFFEKLVEENEKIGYTEIAE